MIYKIQKGRRVSYYDTEKKRFTSRAAYLGFIEKSNKSEQNKKGQIKLQSGDYWELYNFLNTMVYYEKPVVFNLPNGKTVKMTFEAAKQFAKIIYKKLNKTNKINRDIKIGK